MLSVFFAISKRTISSLTIKFYTTVFTDFYAVDKLNDMKEET
jgi:hypothetical protein